MKKNFIISLKTTAVLALTLAFVLAAFGPASAEEKAFKQYPHIVDENFVKKIVDLKEVGLLIDARPKIKKYDEGHIPGAINMPTSQFEKMKGLLPADKNALIVFYCEGLKCALSHKSAFQAEELGYKNIKVYAKGYPHWKKVFGPGCGDPDAGGGDKILIIEGPNNVKKVLQLIEDAGLDVSGGGAPAQTGMFKPGKEEGSIDFDVFKDLVQNKADSVVLVDNRDANEYKKGTLPTALNIPVEELEKKLPDWKPGKPVILFCGTGARSGEAYYMIKDMRPDIKEVYYVDGELTFDGKGGFTLKPPK